MKTRLLPGCSWLMAVKVSNGCIVDIALYLQLRYLLLILLTNCQQYARERRSCSAAAPSTPQSSSSSQVSGPPRSLLPWESTSSTTSRASESVFETTTGPTSPAKWTQNSPIVNSSRRAPRTRDLRVTTGSRTRLGITPSTTIPWRGASSETRRY